MALIRKIDSIKNARAFSDGITYMKYEHKEVMAHGKIVSYEPVYDEEGNLKERENYIMTYLKADGTIGNVDDFNNDCMALHLKYGKCLNENDRKAHHYVISFPEADKLRGLTIQQIEEAVREFVKKNMPGHNALITVHNDTDNLHAHIILQNLRAHDIEQQPYMLKTADGQRVKPSQMKAGCCHTNHPQYRTHLMHEVDKMCHEKGFVVENYSNTMTRTKAQERMDYMHDSVLAAAQKSNNLKELQDTLEKEYNLKLAIRGQAIRIYHPDLQKPKRIEHIGLTPYDLTPDLHRYYHMNPKNYEGVHEKWDNPETRYGKEYVSSSRTEDPEEGKLQIKNDECSRKGWTNSKTFRAYNISRFNDEGEPRSLAEMMMILAYTVINGEMPDYAKTQNQKRAEERSEQRAKQIYKPKAEKMQNMNLAVKYARELKLETPEQVSSMMKDKNISSQDRAKAKFIKEQLDLSGDKEYCYGRIFRKRQKEIKEYSRETVDAARRQLDEINRRNKHKKPKQEELEEYQREQDTAHKASYYIMVNQARGKDRSDGPTK